MKKSGPENKETSPDKRKMREKAVFLFGRLGLFQREARKPNPKKQMREKERHRESL